MRGKAQPDGRPAVN